MITRTVRSVVVCSTVVVATALAAQPAMARATVPPEGAEPAEGMTFLESFGIFVAAPVVLFAVIALAVLGPSLGKGARHRTGAGLESGPVWVGGSHGMDDPVLGNPGSVPPASSEVHATEQPPVVTERLDTGQQGGASGRW